MCSKNENRLLLIHSKILLILANISVNSKSKKQELTEISLIIDKIIERTKNNLFLSFGRTLN